MVVNDVGAEVDGSGTSIGPASEVVAVIRLHLRGTFATSHHAANHTIIAAMELARFGVTVNAIAPEAFDPGDPANIAPLGTSRRSRPGGSPSAQRSSSRTDVRDSVTRGATLAPGTR